MSVTLQNQLDNADPNDLPDRLRQVEIGTLVAGMIPALLARTAFTSSATQIDRTTDAGAGEAGVILAAEQPAGTKALIVGPGATPGAGEVSVAYDADGVPTLTFPGAVTAYSVVKMALPTGKNQDGSPASGLGALLAASI